MNVNVFVLLPLQKCMACYGKALKTIIKNFKILNVDVKIS